MEILFMLYGTAVVTILAAVFAKLCLYDNWYKNREMAHAKRYLAIGCVLVVLTLASTAELVVEVANFKSVTFGTDQVIQLDRIEIDEQTGMICWAEVGGEQKQASLNSVGLSFGAEEPWLHEDITESYLKSAFYFFGLREIRCGGLTTKYTFHLPDSLKSLVRNYFKQTPISLESAPLI